MRGISNDTGDKLGASVVAGAIAAKERHIVERFRDAGATSPASAITTSQAQVSERIAFRRLRSHEVIREVSPGMYYLDEGVWIAVMRARHRFFGALLVVMMAVGLGVAAGFLSLR